MRIYFLLCACTAVVFGDKETEEEGIRRRIIEQLKTRTVLLDDFSLVKRLVATDVYMYRSYRTVSVVFYPVSRDVAEAHFTFQSEELHRNNIGRLHFENYINTHSIVLNFIFLVNFITFCKNMGATNSLSH